MRTVLAEGMDMLGVGRLDDITLIEPPPPVPPVRLIT